MRIRSTTSASKKSTKSLLASIPSMFKIYSIRNRGNRKSLPNLKSQKKLKTPAPIHFSTKCFHEIPYTTLTSLFRASHIRCWTLSDPSASASVEHEWAGVVGGSHGSVGSHHLSSVGGRSVRGHFIIAGDRRDRSEWSRVAMEWLPASIDIV